MLASILASLTLVACSDTAADPGRLEPGNGLQSAAAIIEVAPAEVHIETPGQSIDLSVDVRDKKGKPITGRLITWTSLHPSVVRVENTGRVTALAKGEAAVLATVDGLVDTARVFVRKDPPPAASIEIIQGSPTIPAVGGSITLAVNVRDESGEPIANAPVTWESLNPAVATVSSAGKVFGIAAGSAPIVARYGALSDTVEVVVGSAGAAQLEIVPEVASVAIGGSTPLSVTLRDAKGGMQSVSGVTWESSNPVVATVDNNGVVTGLTVGVVQILARHGNLEATSVVQVGGAGQPAEVVIATETDTIPAIGATVSLAAVVLDSEGNEVPSAAIKWVSLDPSVAVVGEGTVAGVQKGVGRVAARHGALADTATLWVAPAPPSATPSALQISPAVDTIPSIGGTASLTAVVFDAQNQPIGGKAIVWSSLDIEVAEVDANGVVTSGSQGVARIVATHGALADTATVYVRPTENQVEGKPGNGDSNPTFTVIVEPDNDTIPKVGATLLFEAAVLDASGKKVTTAKPNWKVLDSSILSLSATSQVRTTNGTAKAAGTTRVIATYGSYADTVTVTVKSGSTTIQPVVVRISPQDDTIPSVGGTTTLAVDLYDSQGNAIANGKAAWASLDPSIASVGSGGTTATRVITGLAKGTARITATASGVTDTATVVVLGPTGSSTTISVVHSPDNPTTANAVTITATASNPAQIASMTIELDGNTVKTCTGGTCSYSDQLAAGPHTYSASALDASGNTLTAGPVNFTVWLAPSGGGGGGGSSTYSPTSPHWRHMRTSTIDYRIHYQKGAQRDAEYAFAAGHYDLVAGGDVKEYKSRNPTMRQLVYDLLWTERQQDAAPMETWLAQNGYNVEDAYLHKAGAPKTKANRLTAVLWNSDRWIPNPGDPGFKAWRQYITPRITQSGGAYSYEGIMFDEFAVSTIQRTLPATTAEYGSFNEYLKDLRSLIAAHRNWVPGGFNILNSYQYFNKPEDKLNGVAAGGVMTEFVNSPFTNQKWAEIDYYLDNGAVVEMATGVSSSTKGQQRGDVNPGNYNTIAERVLMWEYASYLMVVRPNQMDQLYFETYGLTWSVPHSATWLEAFEYDIGLATGKRANYQSGTDGAGQSYTVVKRDFENGFVLIRPGVGSKYGDVTAVDVQLPAGTWRMLRADGSVSGPVSKVKLRNSEAVIFVK